MPPSALLIEIGVEELPGVNLELFYAHGVEKVRTILTQYRLDFKAIRAEATPRRLAFFVESLESRQKEEKATFLGPAHEKAYDAAGNPTAALQGFLKARRASLREVRIQETPRGRYAALEKVHQGESTIKLLPRLIPEILTSFPFPKTMRWEKSGFRFPRPIRWAVVLYGRSVVSFSLAGIKTGRLSRGHRFLAPSPFPLSRADGKEYEKRLRAHHVILSLAEREAMIQKRLTRKFHQKEFDGDLVHEAALLVEEPFLIQGKFSGTYRDLPEEVLATCMKKYQKIFACRDEAGKLMNRFIAVLNGRRNNLAQMRSNYENVLASRLWDAEHFYYEDAKNESLENKVPRLKELIFLGKLGTMLERTERLQNLVRELAKLSGRADLEESLERIAFLAKADLVTHMVGEFPELQGIMGREYALAAGEPSEIARAIGEQYLPKNLAEDYRVVAKRLSPLGALFGIADRLDLLAGAFGIRIDPTGSEDPHALRRAGGVLVKLIRSFSFRFSLAELIRESYSRFKVKLDLSEEEVVKKLTEFLKDRTAFELQVRPGSRPFEILQGVMKASFSDLADVFKRFGTLSEFSAGHPKVFFKTTKVVERTSNILKGVKESLNSVDPNIFQESLEKDLYTLLQKEEPAFRGLLEKEDYEGATRLYGELFFEPVHDFFDRVRVNVEDASLRRNRQALMKKINALYTEKVADLSLLTPVRE